MFAFGDNLRSRGWPIATWAIAIVTCALYFASTATKQKLVENFAFVPLNFSLRPAANAYTLITAEFLHGDLLHLFGNLIFLLALGRAVEFAVGRLNFIAAFVILGALGFLGSWLVAPQSPVPIIGNSGAISFLLGGYALLFPRAHLRLLPLLKWPFLPAWAFALIWILGQIVQAATIGESGSGVAYFTHIAGFLLGGTVAACWKEFGTDTQQRISAIDTSQS